MSVSLQENQWCSWDMHSLLLLSTVVDEQEVLCKLIWFYYRILFWKKIKNNHIKKERMSFYSFMSKDIIKGNKVGFIITEGNFARMVREKVRRD